MTDFDAVRAAHPELIVNLYAMTPGGAVTLEAITPDGQSWTWTGVTAAECIAQAFPVPTASAADTAKDTIARYPKIMAALADAEAQPTTAEPSIFD